jgi:hypothetical protein
MSPPVSPEFKLLCSLLPVHFRGELPWPSDWRGLDPAAFFAYVLKTQVAPLALHHWETRCPALWESTPFEVRARLVGWLELFRHKQLARFASWRELLAAFAAAALPVIPLKGFVLSQYLYADPCRRQSSDFDLLVRQEVVPAVASTLAGLGFDCHAWLGMRRSGEACWMRPGDAPVNLDVHWALLPPWAKEWTETRWLWDGAASTRTGGVEHLQLQPADLAWFALLNAARDVGTYNLRGCLEALECLARVPAADRGRLQDSVDRSGMSGALVVLDRFQWRFFPDTSRDGMAELLRGHGRSLVSRLVAEEWHLRDTRLSRFPQECLRLCLIGGVRRALPWIGYKGLCAVRLLRGRPPEYGDQLACAPRPGATESGAKTMRGLPGTLRSRGGPVK